jgi:outer membrane lipoprotein
MWNLRTLTLLFAVFWLLGGCAGGGQRLPKGDRDVTPEAVSADPHRYQGHIVEWGGLVVSGHNFRDRSELEILAFPLQSSGRPDRDRPSLGRFVAVRAGYVETAEFAPGKWVTVAGPVAGLRMTPTGTTRRPLPEIQMRDAYLWKTYQQPSEPSVHFGFGVGSWGSGVGVGVGF